MSKLGLWMVLCVSCVAACATPPWKRSGGGSSGAERRGSGSTGLALTATMSGPPTDVTGIEYSITRVACFGGEAFADVQRAVTVPLEPTSVPGGNADVADGGGFDMDSSHYFADHLEVVPAGCYDVSAQPVAAGRPSNDCRVGSAKGVRVVDGQTTDVLIFSECNGAEGGGLDTVTALNHPPHFVSLVITPSKFVPLGQTATACVTARDPDDDPVEFEWTHLDDNPITIGPVLPSSPPVGDGSAGATDAAVTDGPAWSTDADAATTSSTDAGTMVCPDGGTMTTTASRLDRTPPPTSPSSTPTECVALTPEARAKYRIVVRAFDLTRDANGALQRFETWYAEHGMPGQRSRAELE